MIRMLLAVLLPLAAAAWFASEPGNERAACAVCVTLWCAVLLFGSNDPPQRR